MSATAFSVRRFALRLNVHTLPMVMATAALLTLLAAAAVADEPAKQFRAGAYAIDITPTEFPVQSAGSMTPRLATSAHDPLHARCLVLDNGQEQIAFAICDSCMIPRDVYDRAKATAEAQTGITSDHILTSATHTHTAVSAAPTFQSDVEHAYCDLLAERIAEGIAQAAAQLEPAQIGWAVGNNPRQVFNRRWYMRSGFPLSDPFESGRDRVRMNPPAANSKLLEPAGPTDPEVPVLAVRTPEGRPIAVLANYSLHYVGGVPAEQLSADYFGQFAVELARLLGAAKTDGDAPPFVGIMTNGTSGDINNINFFEGSAQQQPFEQIRLVAADVADSAHKAYQRIEWHDWVPLKMSEAEMELGVRRPTPRELADARRVVAAAGQPPFGDLRAIYALETVALADYPPTVTATLQAIRIGELGIVSSPCETFVETGLAIKRESPLRPTFTIELANGYNGYLPTPEQHVLGGYETWRAKSSYLDTDAEPAIRATMLELLNKVAEE
ncbi:MAG: hypothetical protein R3C10_14155 [Pirellulales bacterium]